MSLDNYYPNTEERKRRDEGEKLENTDRNLKEIKLDFSKDLNIIDDFVSGLDKSDRDVDFTDIGKFLSKLQELRGDLASCSDSVDFTRKLNSKIPGSLLIQDVLEIGSKIIRITYSKKIEDKINKLQLKLEKEDNLEKINKINNGIDRLDNILQYIDNLNFDSFKKFIFGIEFLSKLDNKAWYVENKTNLDNLIIKYKENRNNEIENMKGDIEEADIRLFTIQSIELLRNYREVSDFLEEQISA